MMTLTVNSRALRIMIATSQHTCKLVIVMSVTLSKTMYQVEIVNVIVIPDGEHPIEIDVFQSENVRMRILTIDTGVVIRTIRK